MAHGLDNRGLQAAADKPTVEKFSGRFGRMFALLPNQFYSDDVLKLIAAAMIKRDPGKPITKPETVDENPTVAAGYTYFGQFVDHDITFDPTPLSGEEEDPLGMTDFRTPALDLDNVYGRGPGDQPYMYEDGMRLRVGKATGNADAKVGTKNDLFRIVDDIPILGDKRNDENKIVSQIHGVIMAFHNKVVMDDAIMKKAGVKLDDPGARFAAARRLVQWHYQYVVLFDYLDRILEQGMVTEVLNEGGKPRLSHYLSIAPDFAYMPVEFSGAAFRFGHSMVRPSYALNRLKGTQPAPTDPKDNSTARRIPTFIVVADMAHQTPAEQMHSLNGFPGPLPENYGIDWGYFLDGIEANVGIPVKPTGGDRVEVPQRSYRMDALLTDPLAILPEFQAEAKREHKDWLMNLAFRNLKRGQMLNLPSGEAVAKLLDIERMKPDVVWGAGSSQLGKKPFPGDTKGDFDDTVAARKGVRDKAASMGQPLDGNTPLWFYILREAEFYGVTNEPDEPGVMFGGQHLGPVGSRIVAETFIGMLTMDPNSILTSGAPFTPEPAILGDAGKLTLDRLVAYALS